MPSELPLESRIELMRGAAALLNPITWREPFGLVMVEALASATPVLAFPNGAAPEIIDQGRTGYLCRDERQMITAVGRVPEIERRQCRDAAERRFSLALMALDHQRLYRRILCDPASRSGGPQPARLQRLKGANTAGWHPRRSSDGTGASGGPSVSGTLAGGHVTLVEVPHFASANLEVTSGPGIPRGCSSGTPGVLSRWELLVDGRAPEPLMVQQAEPYAAAFLGQMPPTPGLADSTLLVVRRRYVGDGMREDVTSRTSRCCRPCAS